MGEGVIKRGESLEICGLFVSELEVLFVHRVLLEADAECVHDALVCRDMPLGDDGLVLQDLSDVDGMLFFFARLDHGAVSYFRFFFIKFS